MDIARTFFCGGSEAVLSTIILPSILMGLGIAIDVIIATVVQFRDREMTMKNWTLPVTATHILFPAVGYYGWWLMGEMAPVALAPLGLAGFILIGFPAARTVSSREACREV